MRSPAVRAQETSIVSQLDGPRSLPTVNPVQGRMGRPPDQMGQDPTQGSTYVWKTTVSKKREHTEEGSNSNECRRPYQGQVPVNKEQVYKTFATRGPDGRFPNQYPDRGGPPGGGYPGGRPPDGGGPPGIGYPSGGPSDGGPLEEDILGEDPWRRIPWWSTPDGGGPPGPPGGQGPPGPQGPAGPVRPMIVQTPQITLDTTALENTLDTVGQSMVQLARA